MGLMLSMTSSPSSAIEQMGTYQPAQHEETTSVAPLLQFFELVHIGDTIQSMVQVYFDKELVRYALRIVVPKPLLMLLLHSLPMSTGTTS
jgi:hypothetical protein